MDKDYFKDKSKLYESEKYRTDNVENIANAIKQNVGLNKAMHLMDFGSGTGLLLKNISHSVGKITAVDISSSMNNELAAKDGSLGCELEILEMDLTTTKLEKKFDGIISSMALHHVRDTAALLNTFYTLLNKNGFIAVADLDLEDGSFHTEDTGIFHLGFDRNNLLDLAKDAGFINLRIIDASVVHKPQGDYSVFLLIGNK